MRLFPLFLVLQALLLAGCSAIRYQTAGADVMPSANGMRVTMAVSMPEGVYSWETMDGHQIASAEYKAPNPGYRGFRGLLFFQANPSTLTEKASASCMRIKNPEGGFLPVRTSLLFGLGSKEFRLPALELNDLERKTIPNLQRVASQIDHLKTQEATLLGWLEQRHNVYQLGQCVIPARGNKPDGACASKAESNKMYGEFCSAGNIHCGSIAVVEKASRILNTGKQSESYKYRDLAVLFAQNACSVSVDRRYGQSTDPWVLIRSALVGIAVENLYRNFINDNPDIPEQVAIDALTAMANYEWCLNDMYGQCSKRMENWLLPARNQYTQCKEKRRQLSAVQYQLKSIGASKDAIQKKLTAAQQRLDKLRKEGGKSRTYWSMAHDC